MNGVVGGVLLKIINFAQGLWPPPNWLHEKIMLATDLFPSPIYWINIATNASKQRIYCYCLCCLYYKSLWLFLKVDASNRLRSSCEKSKMDANYTGNCTKREWAWRQVFFFFFLLIFLSWGEISTFMTFPHLSSCTLMSNWDLVVYYCLQIFLRWTACTSGSATCPQFCKTLVQSGTLYIFGRASFASSIFSGRMSLYLFITFFPGTPWLMFYSSSAA